MSHAHPESSNSCHRTPSPTPNKSLLLACQRLKPRCAFSCRASSVCLDSRPVSPERNVLQCRIVPSMVQVALGQSSCAPRCVHDKVERYLPPASVRVLPRGRRRVPGIPFAVTCHEAKGCDTCALVHFDARRAGVLEEQVIKVGASLVWTSISSRSLRRRRTNHVPGAIVTPDCDKI